MWVWVRSCVFVWASLCVRVWACACVVAGVNVVGALARVCVCVGLGAFFFKKKRFFLSFFKSL